jgi:hypothetical protein
MLDASWRTCLTDLSLRGVGPLRGDAWAGGRKTRCCVMWRSLFRSIILSSRVVEAQQGLSETDEAQLPGWSHFHEAMLPVR